MAHFRSIDDLIEHLKTDKPYNKIDAIKVWEAIQRLSDGLVRVDKDFHTLNDNISSGVYTPLHTVLVNLSATIARPTSYFRVGNTVNLFGEFEVNPVAAGATSFEMSLPIRSNLSHSYEGGGTAFAKNVAGQGAAIFATINKTLKVEWVAVDTANRIMNFTASYSVI